MLNAPSSVYLEFVHWLSYKLDFCNKTLLEYKLQISDLYHSIMGKGMKALMITSKPIITQITIKM